eukprot:14773753-Alexandrium_andersonii.AAC.1
MGRRSSRGVRSAPFFAQSPNLHTKAGPEGVRGREIAIVAGFLIRNPATRNPRNPSLLARESPTP